MNLTIDVHSGWKQSGNFNEMFWQMHYWKKIFEEQTLLNSLPTTLLQIFCKIIHKSEVIGKSIMDPDDNSLRNY